MDDWRGECETLSESDTAVADADGEIAFVPSELERLRAEGIRQTPIIDEQIRTIDEQARTIDEQARTIDEQARTIDEQARTIDEQAREILELRQRAGYWQKMHERALEREKKLREQVRQLEGEVRKLRADQFGRRSEKQTSKDRSNSLEDEAKKTPKRKRGRQPGGRTPKRRDYSHLPERSETIQLAEDDRRCPKCGELFAEMSDAEISEQIEIDVSAYRRKIIRKRYRKRCNCAECSGTITAPTPAKLIPKSRFGTSVRVEILLDKFHGHCPTGRLIERLRLLGLDLAPGTIAGGLKKLEPMFSPVYESLRLRPGASDHHQADETRWPVFVVRDGKTGHGWWLWVFITEDTCVFQLDAFRNHDVPEGHFADDATGVLLVDRYSAYKAMAQVKSGSLVLAFCWAHVRRDFVKVGKGWPELKGWALEWLDEIRRLYRLNRGRRGCLDDKVAFAKADGEVREQVSRMCRRRDEELADPKLRDPVRKTLESLRGHWTGLTRFVDDPRIPMDNNTSERVLRGPATGRKNYYGSGSEWSGRLAAMLFSIFATLGMWNINPRAWLGWYLDSCAAAGGRAPAEIGDFLPWNLSRDRIDGLNAHPPPDEFDTS